MNEKCEVRPIDANASDVEQISCYFSDRCSLKDVQEWLDEQPTLDVIPMDVHRKRMEAETQKRVLTEKTNQQILENYAPVVHAKWIQGKTHQDYFHCSCCKVSNKMKKSCNIYILPKYCPNCGAKMDGWKDDENA